MAHAMGWMLQPSNRPKKTKRTANYDVYTAKKHKVLLQDLHLFHDIIDTHLAESTAKISTWIIHNKKLILHSIRIAGKQTRLRIKRLKNFFPHRSYVTSTINTHNSKTTPPRRFLSTRIGEHYSTTRII